MCGRFTLIPTAAEVEALFEVLDVADFPPRYNIAPTQPILMVIAGAPRAPGSNLPVREAVLVRWGLIPRWAKAPKSLPLFFNARSETAETNGAFKAAMRHRRTLVPASGFFEWKTVGEEKQPFFVRPRGGGLIAFAGLMETYADPNGSEIDTGTILTTAAGADFTQIHHRVPVVIEREHFSRWLDCRNQEPTDVADLMKAPEPGAFKAIPVSDRVNKVGTVGPELIEPVSATAGAGSVRGKAAPAGAEAQGSLF